MKPKLMKTFLLVMLGEGLLAIGWIWLDRVLSGHGHLTPIIASTACIVVLGMLVYFLIWISISPDITEQVISRFEAWLKISEHLFVIKDFLVVGLIFSIEGFLLTYLSFPLAMRPITVWGIFFFSQAWWVILRRYKDSFHARPGGFRTLTAKWAHLDRVRRRTILVLFLIGLVYFGFFSWVNWHGISEKPETFFAGSGDEVVIYPVAVQMVSSGETLAANVYHMLIHEEYHYGYPFFYLNALVLFCSRMVFGSDFAIHTRVNLFMLRQFISVLPMILAILIFVYLVTRFKSTLYSAAMFVVMLLIPGVVRYNQQFWHPDGLMVLFIALTFYYLQRDRLRFGRDFYYAAIMCALATAVKLYGLFFFLAVAGYLIAGLIRKVLTTKKMILAGISFILVMVLALVASSPFLLVPSADRSMVRILTEKNYEMAHGYNEPDPQHIYRTGLDVWLQFFELDYTQPYFFYFLLAALTLGSCLGSEKNLNRLLLAWCLVVGGYLIYFVAAKSYQYSLPLMLPLYAGGFLLPAILKESSHPAIETFFKKPLVKYTFTGLVIAMIGSQFLFNLWAVFTSPYVRIYY